jgi:hypothetical protein
MGVEIFVMEQTPYLPLELFRKLLIKKNVLGVIYSVYNDFNSYSYHGVAQIKNYTDVEAISVRSEVIDFKNKNNISWQQAKIVLEDGSVLFHQYSDHFTDSPICQNEAIRIYGEKGSIHGYQISVLTEKGEIEKKTITRNVREDGSLDSLQLKLSDHDLFEWVNPFKAKLSDEQLAIANLLSTIIVPFEKGNIAPYTAKRFLKDIEITQAMNISAQRLGAHIRLPLHERFQKLIRLSKIDKLISFLL